jgi:hypothetical protein
MSAVALNMELQEVAGAGVRRIGRDRGQRSVALSSAIPGDEVIRRAMTVN